jgi:hypothetical protein
MPRPSAELLSQMQLAAELKAAGNSWEAVGRRLERSPETCRRWQDRFPNDWIRLLRAAQRRLLDEAGNEALFILRDLSRTSTPPVRASVGKFLAGTMWKVIAVEQVASTPTPADAAILEKYRDAIELLESMTDEQAKQFVLEQVTRHRAEMLPALPGPDPGAGPPVGE